MKMKVLCVIDSLGSGGAQRQFVNIVNGLSLNYDVEVFLYNPGSNFFKNDLNSHISIHVVTRPQGARGFRFDVLKDLISHHRRVDTVISFLPAANIYCAMANLLTPEVTHICCEMSVVNETESWIRRRISNIANFLAEGVVCNSITQAKYIESRFRMKEKVAVVWNGCDIPDFHAEIGPNEYLYDFIVVARVAYPKNGLQLLHAIKAFYTRNGYVPRVAWAGRDDSDQLALEMKASMLKFLENYPEIKKNFFWLGEVGDVSALMRVSRSLVSVSRYEGVPVVICEAMLVGCPVIASRISDNSIILGDGERGFLCDPHSAEDICNALEKRLAASQLDILEMCHRARVYALRNFSLDKMVSGYIDAIEGFRN